MNVNQIAQTLEGQIVVNTDADVDCFYVGDFLSRVMGSAPSDSCWITIMNNVNVAGVAVLAEVKVIVLCEGVLPLDELRRRCEVEGIALICTQMDAFKTCALLGNL